MSKQIEAFGEFIKAALSTKEQPQAMNPPAKQAAGKEVHTPSPPQPQKQPSGDSYPNVFEIKNGKPYILVETIPGNGTREKATNVARLVILGHELAGKNEPIRLKEIGVVCKAHGCYDKRHFSQYIKDENKHFVVEGKERLFTGTLTAPGRIAAKALATQLNQPATY